MRNNTLNIGGNSSHKSEEIGGYYVDDGNYIYRMTQNGKEVIAVAETFHGAEFIVRAINNYKEYELSLMPVTNGGEGNG